MSFNKVIMMGRLTRDPELKSLSNGKYVCKLGIATNRSFKNKQTGEMDEEVCFVDIDVFGYQAESCSKYLKKGSMAHIEGRLRFNTWERDGKQFSKHSVYADRVTFLPKEKADKPKNNNMLNPNKAIKDEFDDNLPF